MKSAMRSAKQFDSSSSSAYSTLDWSIQSMQKQHTRSLGFAKMNFTPLTRQIERCISRLSFECQFAPASILTEYDLKSRLHHLLSSLPATRRPVGARHRKLPAMVAHSDLSWFDEDGLLRIRPDITMLEPERIELPHRTPCRVLDPFSGCGSRFRTGSRLPSKQFAFSGDTVTLELKFARNGIDNAMARLIRKDVQKMYRLFRILDDRGEGDSIFSYLVIFNRLDQPPWQTPLAGFLRDHLSSARHRIIYQTLRPDPKVRFRSERMKSSTLMRGSNFRFPFRR